MQHLPAFFDLAGKCVVVIGDTAQARQREALAAQAGAAVRRLQPPVAAHDFTGAALVFVATGAAETDAEAASLARRAGIAVNVVDRPELCDFIVPAIVDRQQIVIGISTGGTAPLLARRVRSLIEAALPARLGALAELAASFRHAVRHAIGDHRTRRRFWDWVLDGPVSQHVLAGNQPRARAEMLRAVNRAETLAPPKGSIHLVGAGPGDPDLLTLRALQLLQSADVILHDALIGGEILAYARREAECIDVGKRRGHRHFTQDEINALLVAHARAGKTVVRLKGGDPFIFGRGGEERDHALQHGIDVFVVPGVTAALGCAAASGIPLTHRDWASGVSFVTGHRPEGEADADWQAIARSGHTIVVYMGLANAGRIRQRLLEAGLDPATPVAIVERGTQPDQNVYVGTLRGLAALAAAARSDGPALLIVGKVAGLADAAGLRELAEAS